MITTRLARALCVASALLALALRASPLTAQTSVQIGFSGGPGSFGAPTAADYSAGTLEGTSPLPYQVVTSSEPAGSLTTTVSIRSSSPTLGGGKPAADLEWRRGDDATWHALTTSNVVVESKMTQCAPEGHSWDNTIVFRIKLHWTSDPPATYIGNLVITVSASR